tara:strand:+ start:3058 stop:4542 length:1485 start_codon:yes stop_codon:yes gene_type:complete
MITKIALSPNYRTSWNKMRIKKITQWIVVALAISLPAPGFGQQNQIETADSVVEIQSEAESLYQPVALSMPETPGCEVTDPGTTNCVNEMCLPECQCCNFLDQFLMSHSPVYPSMKSNRVQVGGWLDQGFTGNFQKPSNNFNLPVTFNDRSNEYQMNQLYLFMERQVNYGGDELDWGFRADLLYGTDYFYTTALGLETESDGSPHWNSANGPRTSGSSTYAMYGLAMPQLYAELYVPWLDGVSIKAGHFYTPIGYEKVTAPDNFFYSHSYSMQYGEPFTHTGILTTFQVTEQLQLLAGVARGWDAWEDPNDDAELLAGIGWNSSDKDTSINLTLTSGDQDNGVSNTANRTLVSFVLSHNFSDCLTYVFQSDFGIQDNGTINNQFQVVPAKWYSFNQYLYYDVTETFAWGARFEYFRDQNFSRVLQIPEFVAAGGNYYELTVGANWRPHPCVTVRPELRFDWSDTRSNLLNIQGPYRNFQSDYQVLLGGDVIIRF